MKNRFDFKAWGKEHGVSLSADGAVAWLAPLVVIVLAVLTFASIYLRYA